MIIDVNAYLGSFAFRRLRNNTAASLLELMDSHKIDRACVSSADAITYRNAQAGNEALAEEVGARHDRLIPFAVLNPAYIDWEEDLRICHEEFGMRGLRLYPYWHDYRLSDPACLALVRAAGARKMVVSIPIRVEDHRERSWLVDIPDVPLEELTALVKACPETQFLLLSGSGFTGSPLGQRDNGLPNNYRIEISRLSAVLANEIGALITAIGSDRLVLGSGMPFQYPDPALLKVEILDASPEDKERILGGNAAALLST